jgi:hypothetical protein
VANHRAHWQPNTVSAGDRKAANKRMDKHVERHPECADADVCVHSGLLFSSAYCVGCNRQIG